MDEKLHVEYVPEDRNCVERMKEFQKIFDEAWEAKEARLAAERAAQDKT